MKPVTVHQLSKKYTAGKSSVTALREVSFEVSPGELFGIIGPDGAGKTTLFRIIATLLLPDAGTATVDGFDSVKDYRAIRNRLGYMPGKFSLYPDLTVRENLDFFATIFNTSLQENYDLVKNIYSQIEPFSDRKAGKLSGGMKQKLALSCALIHRPSVLLLDEPTTGVDAVSRREFWDMLKELRQQGITILVSTPYMDEASRCDRIALMQDSRVLSLDTPAGVRASFGKKLFAAKAPDMLRLLKRLKTAPGVEDAYAFGEYHHVVTSQAFAVAGLEQYLIADQRDTQWVAADASIEDCFMSLMKNNTAAHVQ